MSKSTEGVDFYMCSYMHTIIRESSNLSEELVNEMIRHMYLAGESPDTISEKCDLTLDLVTSALEERHEAKEAKQEGDWHHMTNAYSAGSAAIDYVDFIHDRRERDEDPMLIITRSIYPPKKEGEEFMIVHNAFRVVPTPVSTLEYRIEELK